MHCWQKMIAFGISLKGTRGRVIVWWFQIGISSKIHLFLYCDWEAVYTIVLLKFKYTLKILCFYWLLLFSSWVMSNSLRPPGLQHARPPCPSLSPRVCSDSCPLSHWCCLTITSSAALSSFCFQCFPTSGSFLINISIAI